MKNDRKSLGRGLAALIPFQDEEEISDITTENQNVPRGTFSVKVMNIEPCKDQPRKRFDEEKLEELAESIRSHGIIQPLVVRPIPNDRYELIAGERRWRAAQRAGLKEVPVVVRTLDNADMMELALIENLQRENLNPIEEAMGYKNLQGKGLKQEEISERLGKSRSSISNSLRLLELPNEVIEQIETNVISMGHAKVLLSLKRKEEQINLAKRIVEENLTVRETGKCVSKSGKSKNVPRGTFSEKDAFAELVSEKLTEKFSTKIKITPGNKKGKIEIEYYGNKDLDRILSLLNIEL